MQLCRPGRVRSSRFRAVSYPRCIARPGCRTSACRDQFRCHRPLARAVLPVLALVARSHLVQSWAAKRRSSNSPTADPARRSRVLGGLPTPRAKRSAPQLETGEGYAFSAESAVAAVEAVLADPVPGAHTPGSLLGPDFALRVPGTRRLDMPVGLER